MCSHMHAITYSTSKIRISMHCTLHDHKHTHTHRQADKIKDEKSAPANTKADAQLPVTDCPSAAKTSKN